MVALHSGPTYLSSRVLVGLAKADLTGRYLTEPEAMDLRSLLRFDAMAYFECAALAVGCAFRGLDQGLATWPTVQLYYAVFYALRGLLALSGYCIFYLGHAPFEMEALSGRCASKPPGGRRAITTHGAVLESFKVRLSSHNLLSQDIDGINALDWLSERRVEANYSNARCWEPTMPKHFRMLERYTVRQLIGAYLSADAVPYEFDPDHAILAYPLRTLKVTRDELIAQKAYTLDSEVRDVLRKLFRDKVGMLGEMTKFFE
jgi:hypothetical protein